MSFIGQQWLAYTDQVYSEVEVSEVQVRETRLAFYAGAWAALNRMIVISEEDEMTAIKDIDSLRNELMDFLEREIGLSKGGNHAGSNSDKG